MPAYTTKADKTYTIPQFIEMKSSDEITYQKFSILDYLSGIEVPITNVLYDYQDELDDIAVKYTLTDKELLKYRYKPYLLAYDYYGSVEMECLIYALNDILSPREFDFREVRLIPSNQVASLLGRIYSANMTFINQNRSQVAKEEKNDTTQENMVW